MKTIRYCLLFAFSLIAIGIIGKLLLIFESATETLIVGLALLSICASLYLLFALLKSQERIEAGMIASGIPIYIGTLFSLMHWPGGEVMIISFCGLVFLISIGTCFYTYIKNRKVFEGICYLTFGIGAMFYCFKFLLWPYSTIWFVLFAISSLGALGYFISQKLPFENGTKACLTLAVLLILFSFQSQSETYRFKHLNVLNPEENFAENFYRYAWYLYQEGQVEEAKEYLEIAIYQLDNEDNAFYENYNQRQDINAAIRYQHALDSVLINHWNKYEYPKYFNR